jgi:cell division protein ZapE
VSAPPVRYAGSTFGAYVPAAPSQERALHEARAFAARARRRLGGPGWRRGMRRLGRALAGRHHRDGLGGGLYLVGPVGTGKTHLLAAIHHAVTDGDGDGPPVPAAFVHSSELFRATVTPEAYARDVATRARVLLIDEVELDDPASEVRLVGVLRTLRRLGVVVAATSNAEPERFVSQAFGRDRLDEFISRDFRDHYNVVFVGGEDYRRTQPKRGIAFVGHGAGEALRAAAGAAPGRSLHIPFRRLLERATAVERTRLTAELASLDALFLEGVEIRDSDDALRLLRLIDDLYAAPSPPALYLSAAARPSDWFPPALQPPGLARGIAEKFARTTSRIEALSGVVLMADQPPRLTSSA